MNQTDTMKDLDERIAKAVAHYRQTRAVQRRKQETVGKADFVSLTAEDRIQYLDGDFTLSMES